MTHMLGNPALLLLFRLKLKGGMRKQFRRLKQPKHWVFLILGCLAAFSWVFQVVFAGSMSTSFGQSGPRSFVIAQFSMFTLVMLSLLGSFNYRGLYLPKEEIELAFSAPIARGDLVRYRIFVSWMKSLFAVLLFGIGWATRSHGAYGFIGVFVSILTVSVFGQACSLLLGGAENRIGRILKYIPTRVLLRVVIVLVVFGFFLVASGRTNLAEILSGAFGAQRTEWTIEGIAAIPVVHALLLPFTPWARMVTAETFVQFAPWFLFAVGFGLLLFEATVNVRVDFRELSLATSADVARRVSRMRRGNFNAGQAQVTRATIGWTAPWLFGRGPFGAVAWHKTASIMRKSRGALILSIVIIAFLTILGTVISRGDDPEKLLVGGSAVVAVVGTLYMCAGLRFDFRTDLEIMDRVKTWPLPAWKLFLATILPEVALVSLLLFLAIVGRSLWLGAYHPALAGVLAFQPLVTLTWVALDNAVFLFSPIRYTPGEEGAMQNMGRTMLLMILRAVLVGVVMVVAGLPAWGAWWLAGRSGSSTELQWWAAGAVAWSGLLLVDVALVALGGKMLTRFDVARDRPV